jgi:gamma-glutamylcyclotransferase (GGCT)/AIG2-like uncharacterized protein YtfP
MYYFAYGSNLDLLQMQLRCPDARFFATARLDDHKIFFPRKSFVRDCAVISIEPAEGDSVWGALYEIAEEALPRLDEREGYSRRRDAARNSQNRITVTVQCSDERMVTAETYVATPTENPGLPSPHYIGYLVAAAAECGLPKSQLMKLAAHMPVVATPTIAAPAAVAAAAA